MILFLFISSTSRAHFLKRLSRHLDHLASFADVLPPLVHLEVKLADIVSAAANSCKVPEVMEEDAAQDAISSSNGIDNNHPEQNGLSSPPTFGRPHHNGAIGQEVKNIENSFASYPREFLPSCTAGAMNPPHSNSTTCREVTEKEASLYSPLEIRYFPNTVDDHTEGKAGSLCPLSGCNDDDDDGSVSIGGDLSSIRSPALLIKRIADIFQVLESTFHFVNGKMRDFRLRKLVGLVYWL